MIFVCEKCNCIDELDLVLSGPRPEPGYKLLCSSCLPVGVAQGGLRAGTGEWHGKFPRQEYDPTQDLVINRPSPLGLG